MIEHFLGNNIRHTATATAVILILSPVNRHARLKTMKFFAITDLTVSARSGRPKSGFYVCLSVDTWYLKIQANSRISLLPLLVFTITLYISTASKNHFSCLPDLAETAKFLIAKNSITFVGLCNV